MGYTQQQARDFINIMAPLHVAEAKKRGYKNVSCAIAQSIIEGAAGTSSLAKPPRNNHWGLKCGSAWMKAGKPFVALKTKEEYQKGNLVTITDNFRCYPSGNAEAVAGYYDFIASPRYSGGAPNYEKGNLKTAATYKEYAERLKLDGYATSSSYVNTLCTTVEKYSLARFDALLNIEIMSAPQSKEFTNSVKVNSYLNVRSFPITGDIIGRMDNAETFSVAGYQNGWIKIGDNKWISELYTVSRHGIVDVEHKLNVRAGNGVNYEAIGQTTKNTTVKVVNELNGWYQIITPDGLFGWVSGKYINLI